MNEQLLRFAKAMRRQPTDAEAALWTRLRAVRLSGFKFKRQQPLGDYVVDFVCFECKLIVEVDGGQHAEQADFERTRWLEGRGFTVLRYWNNDVLLRTDDVLDSISRALRDNPSPQPLPRKGGGAKAFASPERPPRKVREAQSRSGR